MSYLGRRIFGGVVQVAGASLLTFALFGVAPGDFYTEAGFDPQADRGRLEALRAEGGGGRPFFARYGAWVSSCLQGDFGVSLAYGMPVGRLVAPRMGATLRVAVPAFGLAWLLGAGLAVAVERRRRRAGVLLRGAAAALALVPEVIGASLLLWVAVWLGVAPGGAGLPVAVLTLALVPVVYLHAAGGVAAARESGFVRMAALRGVAEGPLWRRYVLPAAMNPLISLFGLTVAATVGSSLIVEALTGWPGLGPLFLEAVRTRDYPVVQAVLLLLAVLLAGANLVADLLLYRLDPRIRVPR